ncbi:hypothetical protein HIM_05708 [Hirsutella minnesotensis 3608]|uniref:Uncharacterized protein n=1 Tax=Hirsutella minnesotensis 3608 TaxID=1043627 RepID=A0A0F8A019_9HYPO|nr:hypothetical protein HIM_05708 [Hirsutella minnesotensis 3608]
MVQVLLNGMGFCEALTQFKNELPTVESLWFGLVNVDSNTMPSKLKRAVGNFIYVVCYHNPTAPGKEAGYYRLAVRLSNHKIQLEKDQPHLTHYKLGKRLLRAGADCRMFPLAFFPKGILRSTGPTQKRNADSGGAGWHWRTAQSGTLGIRQALSFKRLYLTQTSNSGQKKRQVSQKEFQKRLPAQASLFLFLGLGKLANLASVGATSAMPKAARAASDGTPFGWSDRSALGWNFEDLTE